MRVLLVVVSHFHKKMSAIRIEEDKNLVLTLGLDLVETWHCTLRKEYHAATLLGKGWVDQLQEFIDAENIDLVFIDPDLTSLQTRNLEKIWKKPVWDRTGLILRIFEKHARSKAGQLQVQLAQLFYQKSRLAHAWNHLERQRGGFGFIGGPGESQMELDRRMIEDKILKREDDLKKVRKTRLLSHKGRRNFFKIALVGYTNAGKSTLFQMLTRSQTFIADQPFATLDPLVRRIFLNQDCPTLLSDTVGFISDLPSFLKLAFQATLEELKEADLILHVIDGSSTIYSEQKAVVESLLEDLSITAPCLDVINKIDLVDNDRSFPENALIISALTGQGKKDLLAQLGVHALKMKEQLS